MPCDRYRDRLNPRRRVRPAWRDAGVPVVHISRRYSERECASAESFKYDGPRDLDHFRVTRGGSMVEPGRIAWLNAPMVWRRERTGLSQLGGSLIGQLRFEARPDRDRADARDSHTVRPDLSRARHGSGSWALCCRPLQNFRKPGGLARVRDGGAAQRLNRLVVDAFGGGCAVYRCNPPLGALAPANSWN